MEVLPKLTSEDLREIGVTAVGHRRKLLDAIAALGASVAAYFLTTRWLELRYTFEPSVWAIGIGGGALLVAAGGWLATRRVVNQPPLTTLRA